MELTRKLWYAFTIVGGDLVLQPDNVSTQYLRVGGTMALLLKNIDTDTIRPIKRWRSKRMISYPHIISCPLIQRHASIMVVTMDYTLIPAAIVIPTYVGTTAE